MRDDDPEIDKTDNPFDQINLKRTFKEPKFDPKRVGLPPRPFLYTFDQIANLLSISETKLKRDFIYYDGVSIGAHSIKHMLAKDIGDGGKRDWRVAEQELVRWMIYKKIRVYYRGWAIS